MLLYMLLEWLFYIKLCNIESTPPCEGNLQDVLNEKQYVTTTSWLRLLAISGFDVLWVGSVPFLHCFCMSKEW